MTSIVKKINFYCAIFMILSVCLSMFISFISIPIEIRAQSNQPLREIALQPYSKYSPWNMPIGDQAQYLDAQIDAAVDLADSLVYSDEDFQLLDKNQPVVNLRRHSTNPGDRPSFWPSSDIDYDKWEERCKATGSILEQIHVPTNLKWVGSGRTPNAAAGVLIAGTNKVFETQPFARCEVGGEAYSQWPSFPNESDTKFLDIRGTGIGYGGHGGSGLPASAGNILPSDFRQGQSIDSIRHALKIIFSEELLYQLNPVTKDSYIWPATTGDSFTTYEGNIPEFTMGSLMALPQDFDETSLRSEFGQRVAWTLKNFGAYIVDTIGGNGYKASVLQLGTDGTVNDVQEEFINEWGFSYSVPRDENFNPLFNDWHYDYMDMINELNIITNNGPNSIGGGGSPRQCLAGDFIGGEIDIITQNPNGNVDEEKYCTSAGIILNIKVFLEGALINPDRSYGSSMRNIVSQHNSLIDNSYVDILTLEVKDGNGNSIKEIDFYIDTNGESWDYSLNSKGILLEDIAPGENYMINITHRNHIGVGLENGISLDYGENYLDLATSDLSINSNMESVATNLYALPFGNSDNNKSIINSADRNALLNSSTSLFTYDDKDINMDGIINSTDRNLSINTSTKIQFLN